ncbi:MAG: HK97 gp10 family phage protein [Phycisphaerales bacterium]|nr:HK97 gp10 family phage protein [Phycisphaerales bacterium]
MADETYVRGLFDLQKFLDQLPAKVEKNILRGALRAGAKVVRDYAKATAPRDTGFLAQSIKSGSRAKGGTVTGYAKTDAFYAHLVEYGTRSHWIRVDDEARPGRVTRRGYRTYSTRTLNRMEARGSLVIGGNFVGQSVVHPGAPAKPFLRPALDNQAGAAVVAAGNYIKARLEKKHGIDTSDVVLEIEE